MDLQPSKLSSAATRVWNESAGQFHKKTDLKIDLGLQTTISPSSNSTNSGMDKTRTTTTTSTAGAGEKASTSVTSGYVFGSRVFERVAKPIETSSSGPNRDNSVRTTPMDVSSIFRRMAQKVAETSGNAGTNGANPSSMWKTGVTSNGGGKELPLKDQLSESASELAKQQESGTSKAATDDQNPITTGEEEEHHLLQISCKFYHYNPDSKEWQERGMGTLRLNQHIDTKDDVRLVGRQSGSQRVLINSNIFPEMLLEELSEKRVKISAQTGDSDVPQLFLIQASPASIANLQTLLRIHIDASQYTKAQTGMAALNRKRRLTEGQEEEEENTLELAKERREKSKKYYAEMSEAERSKIEEEEEEEERGEEEEDNDKSEDEEQIEADEKRKEEEEEVTDEDDEKEKERTARGHPRE